MPKMNMKAKRRETWMRRCMQFDRTAAIGMISRGTGTRLMRLELSRIEVVPVSQDRVKKLYGTRPLRTKTAKCGMVLTANTFVQTKVRTPIMTRGFSKDQKMPSDMFRYLILKSFFIRTGM